MKKIIISSLSLIAFSFLSGWIITSLDRYQWYSMGTVFSIIIIFVVLMIWAIAMVVDYLDTKM